MVMAIFHGVNLEQILLWIIGDLKEEPFPLRTRIVLTYFRYSLKGFGSEKFIVDPVLGEISLARCGELEHCLDYERQTSYSLTYLATDGGGKVTSVNLFLDVLDENDNSPVFSQMVFRRTVDEGATEFVPPLLVEVGNGVQTLLSWLSS